MNQMADYFPSDDFEGDSSHFDHLTWNWPKLAVNDIIWYNSISGSDHYKSDNMIKVSDALMPRVIEATATLLYYFAQETWERFGEDGIHFVDSLGVDHGRHVIWFSNISDGTIIDPADSNFTFEVDAIGNVANKVEFLLYEKISETERNFLDSGICDIATFKANHIYSWSFAPSSYSPGDYIIEIKMKDIWNEVFEEQTQEVSFRIGPPVIKVGTVSPVLANSADFDHICGDPDELQFGYGITGNQSQYLKSMYIVNADEGVVHTIASDETTVNGTYTDSWDFFLDDPEIDIDGDGKLDPGAYKLVIDLKDSSGQEFLFSQELGFTVKSGEYFLPEYSTIDNGIRIDIGGMYSKGSIDQVDAPFVLKLSDDAYRMYYEAGHDSTGQGWYRRIMTAHSNDGINWIKDGEITGLAFGLPDYQNPSAVILPDNRIRLYYYIWARSSGVTKASILSAISDDGINFVDEGTRISYGGQYDINRAFRQKIHYDSNTNEYIMYYSGYGDANGDGIEEYHTLRAISPDGYDFTKEEIPIIDNGCFYDRSIYNPNYTDEGILYYVGRMDGVSSPDIKHYFICEAKKITDTAFEKDHFINFVDAGGNELFKSGLMGEIPFKTNIDGKDILYFSAYDGYHKRIYSRGFEDPIPLTVATASNENGSSALTFKDLEGAEDNINIQDETTELPAESTFFYVYPSVELTVDDETIRALSLVSSDVKSYEGKINVKVKGNSKFVDVEKVKLYIDDIMLAESDMDLLEWDIYTQDFADGIHTICGKAVDRNGFEGIKELICEFRGSSTQGGGIDWSSDDDDDTDPVFTLTELTGFNKPTSLDIGTFQGKTSILVTDRNASDIQGNDSVKVFDLNGTLIDELKSIHKPERISLSESGNLYLITNNRDGIYRYSGTDFEMFIDLRNAEDIKWNAADNTLCVLKADTVFEYDEAGTKINETSFNGNLNSFACFGGDIIANLEGSGEFISGETKGVVFSLTKEFSDYEVYGNDIIGIDKFNGYIYRNGNEIISSDLIGPTDLKVFKSGDDKIIAVADRDANKLVFLTIKRTDTTVSDKEKVITDMKTYPNPAKGAGPVKLAFKSKEAGTVVLSIFTLSGEKVFELREQISAGDNTLEWGKKNRKNIRVSSGVYFYNIELNGKAVESGKVMITR